MLPVELLAVATPVVRSVALKGVRSGLTATNCKLSAGALVAQSGCSPTTLAPLELVGLHPLVAPSAPLVSQTSPEAQKLVRRT
jgi:hypothetical protein